MTTQREMKERLIEARYQAEKSAKMRKEEAYRLKKDNMDIVLFSRELAIENGKLKKELEKELKKANKLINKLSDQVRVLLFERDVRLAIIKELRDKLREKIK